MLDIAIKLIPIFVFFSIGVALRKFKIATPGDGVFLTKFIFYVTMPALILLTVSNFEMTGDRWLLPIANIAIDLCCLGIAWLYTKWKGIRGVEAGTLIVGAAIINSVFMFPFVYAFYGQEGLAKALIFDFGNVVAIATVIYGLAFSYSGQNISRIKVAIKVLTSPIVAALCIALTISLLGLELPSLFYSVVQPIGDMTMPCLLIGLGILFSVQLKYMKVAPVGIVARMFFGPFVGIACALLLGFQGETFEGFTSLTLASVAKLDVEFATTMASASVFVGLFTIPLVIALLGTI